MTHYLTAAVLAAVAFTGPMPPLRSADPPVVVVAVDGPTEARPYTLVRLGPKAAPGTQVDWEVTPADAVDCERLSDGRLIFTAPPGKYVVRRWAINFENKIFERSSLTVTIGDPPPPPPPPTPPTPPAPTDPLTKELQALFAADPSPTKAQDLELLAELYAQAQALAEDTTVTTIGTLFDRIAAASRTLIRGRLETVHRRIVTEIAGTLGDDPSKPLTAETRAAAKALFGRIHTALKAIK